MLLLTICLENIESSAAKTLKNQKIRIKNKCCVKVFLRNLFSIFNATSLHKQFPVFLLYRPDLEITRINILNFKWQIEFNVFPLFSLIVRITQRIWLEQSSRILIMPNLPTQALYSILIKFSLNSNCLNFQEKSTSSPNNRKCRFGEECQAKLN